MRSSASRGIDASRRGRAPRPVAEEVAADPRYADDEPIGPDDDARQRFREFARKQLGLAPIPLARRRSRGRWQNGSAGAPSYRPAPASLALLAFGSAEAVRAREQPGAAATAWGDPGLACRIRAVPAPRPSVTSPPQQPRREASPIPPTARSWCQLRSTASAITAVKPTPRRRRGPRASSPAISLFNGEITADAITARASAGTGHVAGRAAT